MKSETAYLWRIKWGRRTVTTASHQTEEVIHREHPEAEKVAGSEIERDVPETEEERMTLLYKTLGHLNTGTPGL